MEVVSVLNRSRSTVLASTAECAVTFASRAKGLLGRTSLAPGAGLLIRPCRSVHMWGMRFAIDVVYVSKDGIVVACVANLRPWRIGPYVRRATWVLELPAGTIAATGTERGDRLEVVSAAEQRN